MAGQCPITNPRLPRDRAMRWLLAICGVVSVAIGGVGVIVPGLPTTVFLLIGSWCFARSCPWFEERLIRIPLFRPFQRYLEPGTRMPRRAVVTTLVVMWLAVGSSSLLLATRGEGRPVLAAVVLVLGLVGSWFVWRLRERRDDRGTESSAAP